MTKRSKLIEIIDSLKDEKVLCIGDVMLDRFIYGKVDRISPEAPIPVLLIENEKVMLGGAGNVVRNLVSLGLKPYFITLVGDDSIGSEVTNLIGQQQSVEPYLIVEPNRKTTLKTRYIAEGQQLLRSDYETACPTSKESNHRILQEILKILPKVKVITLSDYGKGLLSPELTKALIQSAHSEKLPIIVDPKHKDFSYYRGATIITPNRKELHEATRMAVDSDDDIVAASRWIIEHCGIEKVLATRSQDGMSLVTRTEVFHFSAEAREVFDVSGAGDTVVATLAGALATGVPLEEAAELANIAAGIVVGKAGTAVVYDSDLKNNLRMRDTVFGESKLFSLQSAKELTDFWKLQGYRVGFANGCFDLLHPGHLSLLTAARSECDKLVIGLNSDVSVKNLKGETRPIQNETTRATILSALTMIDMIVLFDEQTPLQIIETLSPDLLVKGADYTIEQVVGATHVIEKGGKVLLADLKAGFSTTSTIARMTKNE